MRTRAHTIPTVARRMAGRTDGGYSRDVKRVAVETFRRKSGEYLRRLLGGEGFAITHRGRVVAELKPTGRARKSGSRLSLDELVRAGVVTRPKRRGVPRLSPLPIGERVPLKELLRDLRVDRDAR